MHRAFFAVLLLIAGAGAFALRAGASEQYASTRQYDPRLYLPSAKALPWLSLGHREAFADVLWAKTLVYYGEELGERGSLSFANAYVEAMTTLDPYFRAAYLWAGTTAIYRTTEITGDDVRSAIAWLERACEVFPNDGKLAWELGAAWAFELSQYLPTRAERDEALRQALPHFQKAVRLGEGPAWMSLTNVSYMLRIGEREQAVKHLEEMYSSVRDDETREQIRLQLERLRGEAFTEAFRAANRQLEDDRKRDYPYIDSGLYMLLGPRSVDLNRWLRPSTE